MDAVRVDPVCKGYLRTLAVISLVLAMDRSRFLIVLRLCLPGVHPGRASISQFNSKYVTRTLYLKGDTCFLNNSKSACEGRYVWDF